MMSAALSGLAVGLGALFPNFKEDNPSKIVSGFGGTLCLVVQLPLHQRCSSRSSRSPICAGPRWPASNSRLRDGTALTPRASCLAWRCSSFRWPWRIAPREKSGNLNARSYTPAHATPMPERTRSERTISRSSRRRHACRESISITRCRRRRSNSFRSSGSRNRSSGRSANSRN